MAHGDDVPGPRPGHHFATKVPMSEPVAPQRLPAVLQGRYRLGEVIGRGGASVVLRAHDDLLGRDVAIKVFTARAADPQDLRVQESEARMLGSLNHHALVTLLDAGIDLADVDNPQVFLVLELVRDADLRRRLTGGPLAPVQVAYLGFDLAGALSYVHEHGIIHRDVKPANVLLVESGGDRPVRAKLADFGIALLRGHVDSPEAPTTGTAAYLSPEQVEGVPLTSASDVYSLGLVLIEGLTAKPVFPGSVIDSALARLDRDPGIPDSVPAQLADILRQMTARNAADRPDAARVEAMLRAYIVLELGGGPKPLSGEAARIEALRRYNLLDTPPDDAFDRITGLAARIFQVPMAVVALADSDRIWVKSAVGVDAGRMRLARDETMTGGLHDRTLVIDDIRGDDRIRDAPTVARAEGIRFYAGVPLITSDGFNLGALAVLDREPHHITPDQVAVLEDLGAMVLHEMELRLAARRAVLRRD